MDKRRRKWLKTSAAVGAGALATGALPATAQTGGEVLFAHEGSFIPVLGTAQRFPVGRIYCVGRNYAEHAREMGHDPDREPPFFFMKPANANRSPTMQPFLIRKRPRTCITRSSSSLRWARVARTFGDDKRWIMCGVTAWAST